MNDLTVFLISCNDHNPNYNACLNALKSQEPPVNIEFIHNAAPMDVAFQAMLDRCKTKFFIQIDQDMVLEPHACATMLIDMIRQHEDVAMVVYMLHDVHCDHPIQGVKIYRHSIMAKYPYVSGTSCERNQVDRFRADGYRFVERWTVLGDHSPQWTERLAYERYYDLGKKWGKFGYKWLEDMPRKLWEKCVKNPSRVNLFAFLGFWEYAMHPELAVDGEKDYRVPLLSFVRAKSWLSQPTQATIYLTDKCNLKCHWCLRQGDMAHVASAEPFDCTIVDEMMERFPSLTSVCLCGFGETLLHPNLSSVIDRCMFHKLWTGIITNGVLLEKSLPMLLEHRPSAISISLNASSAGEHAWETGVDGAWDKIMAGISAMREHRKAMAALLSRDNGIPLFISRVCTARNLDGVAAFLKLAVDLEIVAGVDLHNLLPHDVGSPETEAEFLDNVLTVKHWGQVQALKELPGAGLVRCWPTLIDLDAPVRHCEYPFTSIAVDGNRSYSICNSVMPPQPENGTIRSAKCWHSDYADGLRESFASSQLPSWCKYCFRNWS